MELLARARNQEYSPLQERLFAGELVIKVYRYRANLTSVHYAFLVFGLVVLGGAAIAILSDPHADLCTKAILSLGPTFVTALLMLRVYSWMPVSVDDGGLEALLFGWSLRRIPWREVSRIEVRVFPGELRREERRIVVIRSPRGVIRFDNYLAGFRELLELAERRSGVAPEIWNVGRRPQP